jgi:GPH family glycoside/pentoside/hexuronide:cation symporter
MGHGGLLALFFYTDFYGISAAAAEPSMMIARLWELAIVLLLELFRTETNTVGGKIPSYILFGAIPYAVLAILSFKTPDFGEVVKISLCQGITVLLMSALAFINLPYSALGAVMYADTYEGAGRLEHLPLYCRFYREICGYRTCAYAGELFGGGDKAQGFQYTFSVCRD